MTATHSFTFRIAPEARGFFEHRSPVSYLDDLARFVGITLATSERDDDAWLPTVLGDEAALRFACVAFNLHAEQSPWDSTPTEQGEALERVLAGEDQVPTDADIVDALVALGLDAWTEGFGPSRVSFAHNTCQILITTAFNREDHGWEAVYDSGGDQVGMIDGPDLDAPLDAVVTWVQRLWADANAN